MKFIFQWCMYYLAYTPLWISIIFMDIVSIMRNDSHLLTEKISIIVLLVFSVIALLVMKNGLKTDHKLNVSKDVLQNAEEEKFVTTEFLFSYIVPLFAFDFTRWDGVVLFAFFFFTFGVMCIRHNYLCTNVILDVLQYRIFECELVSEGAYPKRKKIITRRNLTTCKGTEIMSKAINNDYLLDYGEPDAEK